jgi:hypothetical protein
MRCEMTHVELTTISSFSFEHRIANIVISIAAFSMWLFW